MKAGAALGLLAGLGALNALGGGRNGTGKRFTGLMDMLDGGGAGASGDKFEGGGLLSMLGNLFAKPLEAQDNVERISRDTNANKVVAEVLKQAITPEQRSSAAMTEMNRQRGLLADQFDPRDQQGATDFRPPATARELTGSADMPPELLPMTTLSEGSYRRGTLGDDAIQNSAFQQLFNRSVAEGYRGADMPSYGAEKRLIEMAKYPNSKYSNNMSEADYASLMPPSLMRQAAGAPDMPLPRVGNQAVPLRTRGAEFYDQPNITPNYAGDYTRRQDYSTKTPYPSGMSPEAPSMSQEIMSFRDFVDAERAAMSGADRYLDPANYRRGYARYLRSMGIDPVVMGM